MATPENITISKNPEALLREAHKLTQHLRATVVQRRLAITKGQFDKLDAATPPDKASGDTDFMRLVPTSNPTQRPELSIDIYTSTGVKISLAQRPAGFNRKADRHVGILSISPQTSIFIAVSHVDFRLAIDSLAQDPMSGCLFVFKNRRSNALKILIYDGQGFVLNYKRWSSGKLTWWPLSHIHVLRGTGTSLRNGLPYGCFMFAVDRQGICHAYHGIFTGLSVHDEDIKILTGMGPTREVQDDLILTFGYKAGGIHPFTCRIPVFIVIGERVF